MSVLLHQVVQHVILLYQYGVIIDAMSFAPQEIDFMDLLDALIVVHQVCILTLQPAKIAVLLAKHVLLLHKIV